MKININKEKFNGETFILDKETRIEGKLASDIKPWLKYYDTDVKNYSDEKKAYLDTNMNTYDYFLKVTKGYGNILMLSYCGKNYTREDVINEVEKYIKRFNKMGIQKGDIISFMMLNNPDIIFMWMALSKIGAISNLIKFDEAEDRINDILNKTKSKYLFINDIPMITEKVSKGIINTNYLEKVICLSLFESLDKVEKVQMLIDNAKLQANSNNIKEITKEIENILSNMKKQNEESNSYKKDKRFISYKEWKKITDGGKLINRPNATGENISVIVYTGGTTGNAKGVPLTNINLNSSAYGFKLGDYGFDCGKTSMSILPPSIAYYYNATYCLMCCGVSVNLIPFFTPKEYPMLLNKYKPNIFLAGPILFKEMVEGGVIKDTSFMTSPISGGDKLPIIEEESANDYIEKHGGKAKIHQGYGESECTAASTYSKDNALTLGSIGIPFINVLVSMFDENNKEIPYGEGKIGEICISGPTVMDGYYKDKEETDLVLKKHDDGRIWLHTSDYGYMDNDGKIYHCGRAKRMITRSGDKVWLSAIEEIVKTHNNVYDCCCVKGEDSAEREVPICHIVFKNAEEKYNTIKELDQIIEAKLKLLYIPKYYVVKEEIPLTEVNKKVDFIKLEKEDINNSNIYELNGKLIEAKQGKIKILKK
ncbi:MAG: AMP-binding protein [Bacilli bacterium]